VDQRTDQQHKGKAVPFRQVTLLGTQQMRVVAGFPADYNWSLVTPTVAGKLQGDAVVPKVMRRVMTVGQRVGLFEDGPDARSSAAVWDSRWGSTPRPNGFDGTPCSGPGTHPVGCPWPPITGDFLQSPLLAQWMDACRDHGMPPWSEDDEVAAGLGCKGPDRNDVTFVVDLPGVKERVWAKVMRQRGLDHVKGTATKTGLTHVVTRRLRHNWKAWAVAQASREKIRRVKQGYRMDFMGPVPPSVCRLNPKSCDEESYAPWFFASLQEMLVL
jgi:hypothetical protein